MKHIIFSVLFILCLIPVSQGQSDPILPELSGEELIEELRTLFKPGFVLSSSQSRDTLFSRIYAQNDSLSCVYTGHTIYLDPTQDPTQAAFMDNSPNGINTEHTWPRALGADNNPPRSDMHHLYPTLIGVNAARANLPFLEIVDNQTERWYFKNTSQTAKPTSNIELYSEIKEGAFEPREDHKGNVARAIFYFYTMYRQEAISMGGNFFDMQRETLCRWHDLDPIDSIEFARTQMIASYQDGKPNPFIIDCTLATRTYCSDVEINCLTSTEAVPEGFPSIQVNDPFPNPFKDRIQIDYSIGESLNVQIVLYDLYGRNVGTVVQGKQASGDYQITLYKEDLLSLNSQILNCQFVFSKNNESFLVNKRILIL